MEALSVRDYRNSLAASFDRAEIGERVLIRRKNKLFALVSLGNEDIKLSQSQKQRIDMLSESFKRSWEEVKQMEAGNKEANSALNFIDEL